MKLTRYRFTVGVTFIAPIISQSSGALRLGMDTAMLRDRNGTPAIPGTLIQGNLRHAWKSLFDDDVFGLGKESEGGLPQRGHLNFSEFWVYSSGERLADLRYRIKIDEETGRTKTGAMQTIESLFPAGAPVKFTGDIFGWFENDSAADDFKIKINKGLLYMPAAGSFKGIGFGRVKDVAIFCPEAVTKLQTDEIAQYDDNSEQIGLVIEPDRAFCFARHLVGNNTRFNDDIERDKTCLDNNYVSEDFIPGGAIKGSIATLLRLLSGQQKLNDCIKNPDFPLLSKHLDDIVFTHAQPAVSKTRKRGHALPQSIVKVGNQFFDIAWKDTPGLINGEAPKFSTDWKSKDWTAAGKNATLNLPAYLEDSRSLILHTAIDPKTGASKDHALFSIEAVNPENYEWLANITLPKNIDKKALHEELKRLLALGLHWLGKTEASAKVTMEKSFIIPGAHSITPDQQQITITLLSSACLLPIGTVVPSTNGSNELLKAYNESWKELSGGSLELIRCYSDQQLIGGDYLHKRFGKDKPYNPRIFTTAGSVFVFSVTDFDKAKKLLDDWSKYGLPQLRGSSADWRENPYIAPNGYGEIAVNLTTAPEPGQNEWQPIEEIKA